MSHDAPTRRRRSMWMCDVVWFASLASQVWALAMMTDHAPPFTAASIGLRVGGDALILLWSVMIRACLRRECAAVPGAYWQIAMSFVTWGLLMSLLASKLELGINRISPGEVATLGASIALRVVSLVLLVTAVANRRRGA